MKGYELFQSLSFEEIDAISDFSGRKSMEAGGIIFRAGGKGTHFFVVVDGQVDLKLPSADLESVIVVGRMHRGDIFGLSPLLGIDRFTTTAECAEPSTVLAVEVAPFQRLLKENPRVGLSMMNVVARAYFSRYVETLRRIQNMLDDLAVAHT
jgi:CRP-like cAMP-binding protein